MAETRYNVIFNGELAEGQQIEEVKKRLAAAYKCDVAKIERTFFAGKTVIAKKDVDYQAAEKLLSTLNRTGGIFKIVEIEPSKPPQPEPQSQPQPTISETPPTPKREPVRHEPRYDIVFYGEIVKGQDVKTVKQQLAQFFKVPAAIVDGMFRGERMALKEDVEYHTAEQYKQEFERTGAICRIEVAGQTAAQEAQKVVSVTPQPERAKAISPTKEKTSRQTFRLGWQFVFALICLLMLAGGAWAGYSWLSSPRRTLTQIEKAIQRRDLASFQKYVATDQIISQLVTQLPEIVATEAGRKAFGDNMSELLDEEQNLSALLQRGVQSVIAQGKLDPALVDESDAIDKLFWILALDDPQKVKFKEFRQEGDHAILALETPVAVYDGAVTLELTLRKTDWRTWQVSEINDLYHFVAQAADLHQTFPFRNLVGTVLYLLPREQCHAGVADEFIKQGNVLHARFMLEFAACSKNANPITLAKTGKIQKAIKLIQLMEPNEKVMTLAYTAKILGQQGDEQKADKLFTEAFELAESFENVDQREWALKSISNALADLGNIDEALEVANLMIEEDSKKADALSYIAVNIRASGDTERADTLLTQILKTFDIHNEYLDLYRNLIIMNHLNKVIELARLLEQKNKIWVLRLSAQVLIEENKTTQATDLLEEALQAAHEIESEVEKYRILYYIALEFAQIDDVKALNIAIWLANINNKKTLMAEDSVIRDVNSVKSRVIYSKLPLFLKSGKFDQAFELVKTLPYQNNRDEEGFELAFLAYKAALRDLTQAEQAELAKRIMVDELHIPMPTTLYAAQPSPLQAPQQTKPAQAVAEKVEKEDGKTLSREKASKLLSAYFEANPVIARFITLGQYGALMPKYPLDSHEWILQKLQQQGFLKYALLFKNDWASASVFKAVLTEKADQYIVKQEYETGDITGYSKANREVAVDVICCERELKRITGVVMMEKNENRARVEYEWTYANPTPFNDVDPYLACTKEIDQIQTGAMDFLLYDDGWRIVER